VSDDAGADIDFDADGEYGFAPAVPATAADRADDCAGTAAASRPRARRFGRSRPAVGARRSRGARRRLVATAIMLGALVSTGSAYAAFAASSGASDTTTSAHDLAAGRQLYTVSCITCHGPNLQGITGQGPGLMPAPYQGGYEPRKPAKFTEKQVEQLAAYIQSIGGGPDIPQGSLRGTDQQIAEGGDLFRLNCAQCHGVTGHGAALSAGKQVPALYSANDKQIYTAMLSGPENMPVFSDNQVTPDQKREIISYIRMLNQSKDPGGSGIGRVGPVSEAIVIWVGGVGLLMISILWIGAKQR
jgi:quinol---cytochrome-c reductase cytochrome c subunit